LIRVFQATQYERPADRGTNQPIVLRGRTDTGEEASIFVKTIAGHGDRPAASGVELFTTLLARELELTAPEPVLVEIPVGFDRVVHDATSEQALIKASPGTNFGTLALGVDWKTWPVEMSTRTFPQATLGNILAFDGLTPMPFRDSHRYRRMYMNVSGVLSEIYTFTFLSSTPLSRGCETILSSRWLPLGLCSQS
jgi:hypothetical protein